MSLVEGHLRRTRTRTGRVARTASVTCAAGPRGADARFEKQVPVSPSLGASGMEIMLLVMNQPLSQQPFLLLNPMCPSCCTANLASNGIFGIEVIAANFLG